MPLSPEEKQIARWAIRFIGGKVLIYVFIAQLAKWSRNH